MGVVRWIWSTAVELDPKVRAFDDQVDNGDADGVGGCGLAPGSDMPAEVLSESPTESQALLKAASLMGEPQEGMPSVQAASNTASVRNEPRDPFEWFHALPPAEEVPRSAATEVAEGATDEFAWFDAICPPVVPNGGCEESDAGDFEHSPYRCAELTICGACGAIAPIGTGRRRQDAPQYWSRMGLEVREVDARIARERQAAWAAYRQQRAEKEAAIKAAAEAMLARAASAVRPVVVAATVEATPAGCSNVSVLDTCERSDGQPRRR